MTTSAEIRGTKHACFASTHWSVVLAASDPTTRDAAPALEHLCRAYWYPLYAFIRRRGHSPADAQDLTQGFFEQLLEKNWIAGADRQKGRFRSFLLMALKRFLANEWDKANRLKRGAHVQRISLPLDTAETRYCQEPVAAATPEQLFEKEWALALLDAVLTRLREDFARDGKAALFDELKPCLVGSGEAQPYATLAGKLGMTEGAVKVAVHRLRARYRACLETQIAETVDSPGEVAQEIRHLFRVLARG